MGHVSDRHSVLLLDVGEEGALVIDLEVEDAVLIGKFERDGVSRGFGGGVGLVEGQRQAVEGGEHGELELEDVVGGEGEGGPLVVGVFREGDGVGLALSPLLVDDKRWVT